MRKARVESPTTQKRLRELTEILARAGLGGLVLGGLRLARGTPLPGFGDRTAEMLVREGRADAVCRHLDEVALGGFA